MDDDVPPWDRPRRFAHWQEADVEAADDGPRPPPTLSDWPLPGRPTLRAVPDPESEAAADASEAPEAVPAPTKAISRVPEGWTGGTQTWTTPEGQRVTDPLLPPAPLTRLESIRDYMRRHLEAMRELIEEKEARDEAPPWEK